MGRNTYNLPFFTMVIYGFYFLLKNGLDFGVFFLLSTLPETGFRLKVVKVPKVLKVASPPKSLEGLKVVKVVNLAVTKQQQQATKQEQ